MSQLVKFWQRIHRTQTPKAFLSAAVHGVAFVQYFLCQYYPEPGCWSSPVQPAGRCNPDTYHTVAAVAHLQADRNVANSQAANHAFSDRNFVRSGCRLGRHSSSTAQPPSNVDRATTAAAETPPRSHAH